MGVAYQSSPRPVAGVASRVPSTTMKRPGLVRPFSRPLSLRMVDIFQPVSVLPSKIEV
jgi:hypothetical protein